VPSCHGVGHGLLLRLLDLIRLLLLQLLEQTALLCRERWVFGLPCSHQLGEHLGGITFVHVGRIAVSRDDIKKALKTRLAEVQRCLPPVWQRRATLQAYEAAGHLFKLERERPAQQRSWR